MYLYLYFLVIGFKNVLALLGIMLYGIDLFHVYILWYNFISLKKENILHVDIFKQIFHIVFFKITVSDVSKNLHSIKCETCQTPLTVKHLLMEYRLLAHIRNRYFKANNMKDLFENVNMEDILSFSREIKSYHRI